MPTRLKYSLTATVVFLLSAFLFLVLPGGSDTQAASYVPLNTSTPVLTPGSATPTTCPGGATWRRVSSPNGAGYSNTLYGVSTLSPNDVWAVGESGILPTTPLILHWNGTAWTASPFEAVEGTLRGVAAYAANDAWAVGYTTGAPAQSLIMHWDGTIWSIVPNPGAQFMYAVAGAASNDVWALGKTGYYTVAMHWDGTSWTIVPTPPITDSYLYALTVITANDIWAVGADGYQQRTLVEHWDGTSWTRVPSPNPGTSNVLRGVSAVGPDDVWAVGWFAATSASTNQWLSMHWDGGSWTYVPVGGPSENVYSNSQILFGVSAVSSTEVWAAGQDYIEYSGIKTAVLRWDGTSWIRTLSESPAYTISLFYAIDMLSSGTGWAVGSSGADSYHPNTLTEKFGPPCNSPTPLPPTATPGGPTATPRIPTATPCVPGAIQVFTGSISLDDPVELGRVEDWDPPSNCVLQVQCDPLNTTPRHYDSYTLQNTSGSQACMTVELYAPDCSGYRALQSAAYLGTFDPDNVCLNFLGDIGESPYSSVKSYSFLVPANSSFVVVVNTIEEEFTCSSYTVRVNGLPNPGCVTATPTLSPTRTSTRTATSTRTPTPTLTGTPPTAVPTSTSIPCAALSENFESGTLGAFNSVVAQCLLGGCGWTSSTGTPHTGSRAAFGPGVNNVSDQYLQLTNPISVVAGAQLIFWHSYNLENTFDGGVLEASTNGGTTWTDMGPNITTGGYNGTISSSFGSPIAGRQAWTGNSTGYIQTTVSLTPYVGWSLLFRFRLATDNTLATPGWRVDDIGVTGSCATGTPVLTSTAVPTSVDTVVPATSTGAPTHTATEEPTGEPTATATPIEACSLEFSDVQPGTTFYSYVQCLACIGVISGYSDGTFHPDAPLTRGQLAKLVSNAAGYDEELTTQTFEDVLPGSTFYQYVERMASRGILGGYPCGDPTEPCVSPDDRPYFRPYINANRGQITKIVANAANMMGQSPSEGQMFEDVATGSTFFDYVQMLGSHGIMGGYLCGGEGEPCGPDNMPYFRPGSEATRGQLSKIVTNTFFPGCQVR